MNRLVQLQTHTFRLLLYLEWILLGITLLVLSPIADFPHPEFIINPVTPRHPLLLFLTIACFSAMGLRLPKVNLLSKLLYIGLAFGLILLANVMNGQGIGFPPPLLLILVIRSCLIFKLTGRLLVASMAFISFVFTSLLPLRQIYFVKAPRTGLQPMTDQDFREFVWNITLNLTLLFGLVLVFVLLLVNALLVERQSREKLDIAHQQLRQYALRIENQAKLQERNRIAREIHDALGHLLTAQSIQLENALVFLSSNIDKARTFLLEAQQLGSNALKEVRQSVATLRYNPLQEKSLESAIALLLADFQRCTDIFPDCTLSLPQSLSAEIGTTIYRIVQEALTNISKHSTATQVKINLQVTDDYLYLELYDNGKGFNPNQNTTGFGIQGMRERTLALGGQFHIISKPKAGCQIIARFPYRG